MKDVILRLFVISAILFVTSCFLTKNISINNFSETVHGIKILPSSKLPELLDFDQILSGYERLPSRGVKMGYHYIDSEGYKVILSTDDSSFNQANKNIDDIINGDDRDNRESIKILIKKCLIKDINGDIVFLREWR
jgi:hypothetical protein